MDLWQLCLQQQEKEPKFVPWVKTDCWVGGCPPDSQAKAFEPAFCADDAPIAEEIISDR
jgi:coenzyme F420-reducing hydrogenase gamma subunit